MNLLIHSLPLWFELTSLVFCIGGLAFLLWALPVRESDDAHHHGRSHLQLWFFFRLAVFAAMAGSSFDLLVRTAEMSGEPILSAFPFLPTVLFKSHVGQVWLIRMTLYIIMSLMMTAVKKHRDSRGYLFSLLCLGVIAAMMESATGHAADKGDFSMAEIMDWFHLLAASVWGGGLFAFSLAILPSSFEVDDRSLRLIAETAARFSRMAGIAVVFVFATAVYNAWVYIGSAEAAVKSFYGWTVIVKTVLSLLLLLLGAFNRYVSVPGILETAGSPAGKQGAVSRLIKRVLGSVVPARKYRLTIHWFAYRIRLEALVVVAILICASLLRHEIPAKHYLHQHDVHHEHHHIDGGAAP